MKILLAVDGSPGSIVARDLVASLPWPDDTTITMVAAYLVPIDWTGGIGSTMDWVGDVEDATRDDLNLELERLAEPFAERGWTVERVVMRGRAADVIVEVARDRTADLIVTGSRGYGPLRQMLLGSVASEVAGTAPCPVLVARRPKASRLLVATDGSKSARRIPEQLAAWGVFRGLPAEVVAVSIPEGPAFETIVALYTLGDERLARQRAELREMYQRDVTEMSARLSEIGIQPVTHLRAGDPAHEILAVAKEREVDLIITGTRGLGGIARLLLGSVARSVLTHADCSVLVIRPQVPEDDEQAQPGGSTDERQ